MNDGGGRRGEEAGAGGGLVHALQDQRGAGDHRRSAAGAAEAIGVGAVVAGAGIEGEALRADREASFVRGISEILPPGLRGVMLAAMLAALHEAKLIEMLGPEQRKSMLTLLKHFDR